MQFFFYFSAERVFFPSNFYDNLMKYFIFSQKISNFQAFETMHVAAAFVDKI